MLTLKPFRAGNEFISSKEAPQYVGLSLPYLKTLSRRGTFPPERTLDTRYGKKIKGWFSSEVGDWKQGKRQFDDPVIWDMSIGHVQAVMVGKTGATTITSFETKVANALMDVVPVMIKGQGRYEPNPGRFLMSGYSSSPWSHLPGYSSDCFDSDEDGYQTWFTVFSDTVGTWTQFHYPEHPKIGDPIKVLTSHGLIHWVHGVEGLARFAQVHYVEWLLEEGALHQ